MDLEELIREGHIKKIKPDKELSDKEFQEADYDMGRAREALEEKDYKWAIVKAYFAVFHSARGILFLMGYREKSHFAVGEILDKLCDEGKLENRYIADFKAALSARQGADYHYKYSDNIAKDIISLAEEFIDRMEELREKI